MAPQSSRSKAEKTGKNWQVRGENWVSIRQVTPPRKSAFMAFLVVFAVIGILAVTAFKTVT
jgi:hypothetical protein